MRNTLAAAALAAAAGLFMATPAQAEQDLQTARCTTGWVTPTVNNLLVRTQPSTGGAAVAKLREGQKYGCIGYVEGEPYRACGTSSSLWMWIDLNGDRVLDGFSAATCLQDV